MIPLVSAKPAFMYLSSQMQMPQPWLGSSRALPYQYDRPYTETLKGQVALPK